MTIHQYYYVNDIRIKNVSEESNLWRTSHVSCHVFVAHSLKSQHKCIQICGTGKKSNEQIYLIFEGTHSKYALQIWVCHSRRIQRKQFHHPVRGKKKYGWTFPLWSNDDNKLFPSYTKGFTKRNGKRKWIQCNEDSLISYYITYIFYLFTSWTWVNSNIKCLHEDQIFINFLIKLGSTKSLSTWL